MRHGADPQAKDPKDQTLAQYAVANGQPGVARSIDTIMRSFLKKLIKREQLNNTLAPKLDLLL